MNDPNCNRDVWYLDDRLFWVRMATIVLWIYPLMPWFHKINKTLDNYFRIYCFILPIYNILFLRYHLVTPVANIINILGS